MVQFLALVLYSLVFLGWGGGGGGGGGGEESFFSLFLASGVVF